MTFQQFQNILEEIEKSKEWARIKMADSKNMGEKEYYCGVIGGVQIVKQHLEKLQRMEEWR